MNIVNFLFQAKFLPTDPVREQRDKSLVLIFMHLLLKTANHIALLLPREVNNNLHGVYAARICKRILPAHGVPIDMSSLRLADSKFSGKMKVCERVRIHRESESAIVLLVVIIIIVFTSYNWYWLKEEN